MPSLNGRHYSNRIFGRAAELGRILARHHPSLSRHHIEFKQGTARISTHHEDSDNFWDDHFAAAHREHPKFSDAVQRSNPQHHTHDPRFSDEVYRPDYYHQHDEPEFISGIGRPGDSRIAPLPLGRETHDMGDHKKMEFAARQSQTQQPPLHHPLNRQQQRHPAQQQPAPKHPAAQEPSHPATPESPAQNANRVYNETSDLRSITKHGPGSPQDLQDARSYIAHVLENRETSGKLGMVAPDKHRPTEIGAIHNYPPAKQAYDDSLKAAHGAASGPDPTNGATHYYMDYGQTPPPWAAKQTPVRSFGPFLITSGGGGKRGGRVYIRVYHLKH